jgi:hypothetical protein
MDFERLARVLAAPTSDIAWKLDALLDLDGFDEPRVAHLMLDVLADPRQPDAVRKAVLAGVRERRFLRSERVLAARRVTQLLCEPADSDLRAQAALVLGELTDVSGVIAALEAVAAEPTESFDVRYAAFTSLERAGATPECVAVLVRLSDDETLGQSARAMLRAWRVG